MGYNAIFANYPIRMKKICITLLAIFAIAFLHAQKDTLFWFAAPQSSSNASNFNVPIVMRITTYNQAATVTITQPAGTMPAQTVTVAANSTQTVDLSAWLNIIETKPADVVLNYGLMVQSTVAVSIYYEVVSSYCNCNPEMFVLKGHNALGTDFFIPGQNYLDNSSGYSPLPYNSFDIIATQDNTAVTITPINAIVGHAAGVPYTITLNHGQTYSATATSEAAAQHLLGSKVTSTNPIAITMKDDLLSGAPYGGCADLGGDQIVPTNILGTEYIASNGLLNGPGDQLFITATQNGTTVSQNGTLLTTINAGQTYQTSVGGASTLIQTSNPAYVAQLSGIGCEIGLGVLPPLLCTGSFEVAFTRSTTEPLYANIAVPSGYEGNFLVNGVAGYITSGMFAAVPGTGGAWLSAQVPFPNASYPVNTAIRVSNSTSLFRLGVLHGGAGSGSRFGYFSDFSQVKVASIANANDFCPGSTIQFTTDSILDATYAWTGPNGFTSTLQNPVITNAPAADSGKYMVTASFFGCVSTPDTVTVNVHSNYTDTVTASVCYPRAYTLPNGSLANTTGNYLVHLTTVYGCDSSIVTRLTVTPPPVYTEYDSVCYGQHFTLPSGIQVNTTGVYTDTLVTTQGCDSVVITHLTINPPPVTTVFDSICYGLHYTLPGGTSVNATGIYTDTLNTTQGCDSVVITHLTINPPPLTQVFDTICYGTSLTLPSGQVVTAAGTYIDTLTTLTGCDSVVTSSLYILPLNLRQVYDTICYGITYTRPNGGIVNTAGIYADTLTSYRGCDSIILTHLAVKAPPLTTIYDTICRGLIFTRPSGITETSAGTYSDTLHTGTGCDSVVTNVLTVIDITLSSSAQQVLCYGQSNGSLTVIAGGGLTPYNYALFKTGTGVPLGSNISGTFSGLNAGIYVIYVSDKFGCVDTTIQTVIQPDSFQLAVSEKDVSCYDKRDGSVTITATGGFPQYSYDLNGQTAGNGNFTRLDAGNYAYVVTDAHGCADSGSISVQQPREILVSLLPAAANIQLGQSLQLTATTNYDPGAVYLWSPSFGLSCYTCPNPVVTANNTTVYSLAVSVINNGTDCIKDTAITITVIPDYDLFIPNTFTPNGDGQNDFFQLFGNLVAVKYVAVQIFNRIGEKVFDSNDPYFKWDGTYKGKALQPEVFTYVLRASFDDGHTEKLLRGSLTLLR